MAAAAAENCARVCVCVCDINSLLKWRQKYISSSTKGVNSWLRAGSATATNKSATVIKRNSKIKERVESVFDMQIPRQKSWNKISCLELIYPVAVTFNWYKMQKRKRTATFCSLRQQLPSYRQKPKSRTFCCPLANVVFVVANYTQQQQQKSPIPNRRRSRMRRTSDIGAQRNSGVCLTFARDRNYCSVARGGEWHVRGRDGGVDWLIAVAQFTTATRLWLSTGPETRDTAASSGFEQRKSPAHRSVVTLDPFAALVAWPQLRLLRSACMSYSTA